MNKPAHLHAVRTTGTSLCHLMLCAIMLIAAATTTAMATPLTPEQARAAASKFLATRHGAQELTQVTRSSRLSPRHAGTPQGASLYYAFDRGDGEGYIIMGADSEVPDVLAYTDSGNFDYASLPDAAKEWLQRMEAQIADVRDGKAQRAPVAATHPAISPLVTARWDQSYPYNMRCPGGSVTGCVATAMAQIMYFHRDKSVTATTADIPGYVTNTDHRTVAAIAEGTEIDWANMRDSYSGSETNAQRLAVANLMLYCGVAVEMDYTTSASGAYSYLVAEGLRKYFGYGASVKYIQQAAYSNAQWDNLLYAELAADRPFYLSGANSEAGHAFVCDGYDGDGMYHINWGWGGTSNGYYLLSKLTPGSQGIGGSTDGYNTDVEAIIGIEPEDYDNKAITFADATVKRLAIAAFDTDANGALSYKEAAEVTDLGTTFTGARNIRSFAELRYFTGLTTINDDAFAGCAALTTVRLPKTLTAIGSRAFAGCTRLAGTILPDALASIGDSAFAGCTALALTGLPTPVTAIADNAFEGCKAITSFSINANVTAIGSKAFAGCTGLTTFCLDISNPELIAMGSDVFQGIDLAKAKLSVLEGGRAMFSTTEQWQDFGTIMEVRSPENPLYETAAQLEALIATATAKNVDHTRELAIYQDIDATEAELHSALLTMRRKLGFIHFADDNVRTRLLATWDMDTDDEISLTEAATSNTLGYAFYRSDITTFDELTYFTGMDALYGNTFEDSKQLTSVTLPPNLNYIYYRAFYGCSALEEITIPSRVTYIGFNTFKGCTSLRTVRVAVTSPDIIETADNAFEGLDLSAMTLVVPHGSRELYAQAPVWKDFGTISEMRGQTAVNISAPDTDTPFYLYNYGADAYVGQGEAWGTQAVTSTSPLVFQLKRTARMPEGVYYLSSSAGILFRTNSDGTVGDGVKTCFVDGSSVSAKAYWQLIPAKADNTFRLQVPETDAEHAADSYLGTAPSHESHHSQPTTGLYYDVTLANQPDRCLWAVVTTAEIARAKEQDERVADLAHLLALAQTYPDIDVTEQQAVYDDFEATPEAIVQASATLRDKLRFISFTNSTARTKSVNAFDLNGDGEVSLDEAASITDIGTTYRTANAMQSLDELRYFTALTSIPALAFASCTALVSLYLPASVTTIADKAFQNATALRYIAMPATAVEATKNSGINKAATIFVAPELLATYQADAYWSTLSIEPFTGTPTVSTSDITREYGRSNPTFTFTVTGAPIDGTPTVGTEAVQATGVGTYPISIGTGTVQRTDVVYQHGTLTIEHAPLTVTARSYSRYVGTDNPEFAFTCRSFRAGDKVATAFTVEPVIECEATADSPAGEYPIRIYGGEAPNYAVTYVDGVLTVSEDPSAVSGIVADTPLPAAVYDLAGRRISAPALTSRGIYIEHGRKHVCKTR